MALRIDYFRKCFACGFEDADEKAQSVIFNKNFSDQELHGLTPKLQISIVSEFLNLNNRKCPECNQKNKIAIGVRGVENFSKPIRDSYVESILKYIAPRITINDYTECFLFNDFISELFWEEDENIDIIFKDGLPTLLLTHFTENEKPAQKWYYSGISKCFCHEEESESFHSPYIEFKHIVENKVLLMEWSVFINLITVKHMDEPERFSKPNLKKIKNLEKILNLEEI